MNILEIKVMRGPNPWSNYRKKLIVMKLDIGILEDFPTNKIDGFSDHLKSMMPSLFTHRCSEDDEGGFFYRIERGTWMGHVIEHIALEIQCLAGMECGYGRTRSTHESGVYNVVFCYELEAAGKYAADAAVRIAQALADNKTYHIDQDIAALQRILFREGLGPSTASIVAEAVKRGIPFNRMNTGSTVVFGYGERQQKIRATITSNSSNLAIEIAGDKEETKKALSSAYIPVPKGIVMQHPENISAAIAHLQFPLVVKPVNGNHGRGITTHITSEEGLKQAFHIAAAISKQVIIEEFIEGHDYRFLVVNYKLAAVARRTPPVITGDGRSTISQLIEKENADPQRGEGHEKSLTSIKINESTLNILASENMGLESVLPAGQTLFLKHTANLSTGGTSEDVTDYVHPFNKFLAENAARVIGLDVCGIDIIAKDITIPINAGNGGFIEVNASPGLRMHLTPGKGMARNVAAPIVDMLFPQPEKARIPIIAVTGTNGKTTTTRLIAHLAKHAGYQVGYTTTEGIYIHDHLITAGDCTGSVSARTVLLHPAINLAVLECARGGIIRSGLGFDQCDVSIITNVTDDHLGLKDIHTLKEMANVKAVVARSTMSKGYAILNADDDLVYNMRRELYCNIALFSLHHNCERVTAHCKRGGIAATVEDGYLVIYQDGWKTLVYKISEIPLSIKGSAECMIKNLLPAVLAAFIQGFKLVNIRAGLLSFIPSPEYTPGRMSIFKFRKFGMMLDYSHNADSFKELKKILDHTKPSRKIGLVAVVGERRPEDIRNIGLLSAEIFDEIIIQLLSPLRGRSAEEMIALMMEGIRSVNSTMPVKVIADNTDAINEVIANAMPGSFIFVNTDDVYKSIRVINEAIAAEDIIAGKDSLYVHPGYLKAI